MNKLAESAQFALGRLLLMQECQVCLFELSKEIIPADRGQVVISASVWEIDSQNADSLVTGRSCFDRRRHSATLLDPSANLIVIGSSRCHQFNFVF